MSSRAGQTGSQLLSLVLGRPWRHCLPYLPSRWSLAAQGTEVSLQQFCSHTDFFKVGENLQTDLSKKSLWLTRHWSLPRPLGHAPWPRPCPLQDPRRSLRQFSPPRHL